MAAMVPDAPGICAAASTWSTADPAGGRATQRWRCGEAARTTRTAARVPRRRHRGPTGPCTRRTAVPSRHGAAALGVAGALMIR